MTKTKACWSTFVIITVVYNVRQKGAMTDKVEIFQAGSTTVVGDHENALSRDLI